MHASCSAQLNDGGTAVFDVDVSLDGGASWTNALRRVGPGRSIAPTPNNQNSDGFYGRLSVELTSLAANQPDVRFRIRHFEPSWDWWVAIDDVLVDDVDTRTGGSASLLAEEGFGSGLPPGWTILGLNSGTETWHTTDKGGRYTPGQVSSRGVNRLQHPAPQPDFMILDSDANPDPAEDELLLTPVLDCSAGSRVFLHYASEILGDSAAREEVLVSLDGGATFLPEPVFSYAGGGLLVSAQESLFAERVLEVPGAAGEPGVVFAFRYASPGNRWWWAIDDVSVTALP
ncbi:MAG: hypothetical protein GY711_15600 [bacterium]|nr:hypothetical protein [bacterium]